MPFFDPEERNAYVDMVAQAVIDKIEERDRINGLADLVFSRVVALQQKQAALDSAHLSLQDLTPITESNHV